jgi:hypothetical protein
MSNLNLHAQIKDLSLDNAIVYANLKTQEITGADDIDTAVAIIRQLVVQNKTYFDLANNAMSMRTGPIVLSREPES